ncbi:DUF3299 domain-containing protein [Shewanella schlegeliana]|uniref:DUF3299 domain-containing protein n=1 Tax=Shewanella schlegeliana TaxID=190308 RepID=A0ABS1T2I1_9GAMM|nr:DUF3299 domain-containing protein [Shewanella schlegeliana]MBL4914978.1 DUF3299 domain-containing protein [Shewanella schlegeliana]MCL1110610.1 DUF3299 domain-containing protein [Shewanella schlegeliana]
MKKIILVLSLLISSPLFAEEAMSILWSNLAPGSVDLPAATNVNLELDGKTVIIPGFIVPLDGQGKAQTKNFLLTPQQGACFHKPPSPPNQLIHVVFNEPIAVPTAEQPVYIAGKLSIKSAQSGFAKTGYFMHGIEAIAYPAQVVSAQPEHQH